MKMAKDNISSSFEIEIENKMKLEDDESMKYLEEDIDPKDQNLWRLTAGAEAGDNDDASSDESSMSSSCTSALTSVYSTPSFLEEEAKQNEGFSFDGGTGEGLERFRQKESFSPPPETVFIHHNQDCSPLKNRQQQANSHGSQATRSSLHHKQGRTDNQDPMQKLAECMEKSALSRGLIEKYCQASLERFKNRTSSAKQQQLLLQNNSNHNKKKNSELGDSTHKKRAAVSRRRESIAKYPISKQIKTSLINQKKHQFFFGEKYTSEEGRQQGRDGSTANFRLTGLKFASSEKLMRLDAKLKMLNNKGLHTSNSAPSLRNATMTITEPEPISNGFLLPTKDNDLHVQPIFGDFVTMPRESFENSPW